MKNKSDYKTSIRKRALRYLKPFVDVRSWSDWDRSKSITLYFISFIKRYLILQKPDPAKTESFNEAVARLQLSEAQLQQKQKSLLHLSILLFVMYLVFLGYAIFQIIYGSWLGVLLSIIVMLISLTLAFRYHFWYFQIKHQKLGCGIKQWFIESFMGGVK